MHPLHFGTRNRKLFGTYLPPAGKLGGSEVVVLANPWGWEALRAHRTMRALAGQLQGKGLGILRFDYFGSGDSFGGEEETDLEGWCDDLEWAAEEALALSGKRTVVLIGLRLGAFISALVAARRATEVSRLVLWEAPESGEELLMDWTGKTETPTSDLDVKGFLLPAKFARGIHSLRLDRLEPIRCPVVLARTIGPGPPPAGLLPEGWELIEAEGPKCWVEELDLGAGAIPVSTLRAIVACLR